MLSTNAKPVTRYEYALIPTGAPNYQLIEGDLVMAQSPNTFHQEILVNLATSFRTHLRTHPIGKVYIAPLDTFLSDISVYQPDLLFVRKENRSIIEEHGVEGAPDLVVEILSKSSAKYDLGPKRAIYARTGVEEMWVIDPPKRTLSVYRLGEDAENPSATYRRTQSFTSTVLPGLQIVLADIFAR